MQISQTARTPLRTTLARYAPRSTAFKPPAPTALQLITLLIVALVSLPIGYLVIRAAGAGEAGLAYLLDGRTLKVISNSLLLTGAVVAAAALIGVPFAWLTARTDLPFRRFWLVAGLLTMVIPSYIGAMMYIAAFGPRGLLQSLLEPFGVQSLPSIYGFWGAWLSITLFTYPYVVLPVRAALLNMDPALDESARSLGMNRWKVFWRVTLPQLRPAMATGMLLTALYTLSDFGAVALMRYDAFTRVIYLQYTSSFDRNRAAILSLVLVAITLALLVMERLAARKRHNYRIGVGCQRTLQPVALGRWRIPALAFCGTLVTVGVLAPVGVLAYWLARGAGEITMDLLHPALNTVGASGLTALVVGVVALPPALLSARASSRLNRWLVQLAYLGNVLPGLVVALALVYFAANYLPNVYQTLPILILGYSTRFLPLSIGSTSSALTQINPRLEEVGRSMGLNSFQIARRIVAPLARAGILAGMALVFLSVMKELPTTLLLSPTGFVTLPTEIWTAHNQVQMSRLGAPSLVLIAVSALSLFIMLRQEKHD
ncbi:MAG: iron ABC transporter permease [Chloroflexota bacterium]|nr:MAG: iron ABC transporter permease [Chloroflexota bacterium]